MIERRQLPHSQIAVGNRRATRVDKRVVRTSAHPLTGVPIPTPTSESLLATMWRGRWIVLLCTVAALAAALAYINAATPSYTSTAKLYLHCENIQISQYEAGTIPRTDKYLHTQAEVLRSRDILTAALGTDEDPPLRTFADIEVPLTYLRENIAIDVGRKDEIISVSFDSPYPLEAAHIVNQVVEAYLTSSCESDLKDATNAFNAYDALLKRCEADLEAKEAELRKFRATEMPISRGMDDGAGVRQGYEECQRNYRQAQQFTCEAKQHLDTVRALASNSEALRQYLQAQGPGLRYTIPTATQLALETRLAELVQKRAELLRQFAANHEAVMAVDTEKERIQEELADLDARFVDGAIMAAEHQLANASANEEMLAARYAQESENVQRFSDELQQFQQLQAEVSRLATSVSTYAQQVKEITKILDDDTGRMRMAILEHAEASPNPSSPQKSKIMALALMAGLVLGGGIAKVRGWADQTFHSVDEISAAIGLPVLGVVPAMSRRGKVAARGQKVLLQPDSPEAEAYRTVRTALFFGAPMGGMRTLLVTSPGPGDGKSTLVGNLAITMAQAGQNTIVLDADLRKPMQHTIFSTNHREGNLNSVFAGRMELAEAIQPTGVPGLSLLTCAYDISNPAELLNSARFAEVLESLARTYDRVLVDAPPVTVVTDAQILGALCDCTLLVMRIDKSSRRTARRAVDALESVGASLFGVVINGVRSSGDGYGYYGRYGRYGNSDRRGDEDGRAQGSGDPALLPQKDTTPSVAQP